MVKVLLHLNASVPLRPNSSGSSPGVVPIVSLGVRWPDHPRSELVGKWCYHGRLRRACSIRYPSARRCHFVDHRARSADRCRSASRRGRSAQWLCRLSTNLSVQKVVPTLTSTSTEIYLSMAGAEQLGDTSFILVPAEAIRPIGVCSRHCIALHHGACRGEVQAWRERRLSLQVPEV
jgi:hypothetical protein